jgi:hypothetical protein
MCDHSLEHQPQRIVIAELSVTVLRKCRMVEHVASETKAAKPAAGQIEVDFITQSLFRPDAEAVAHDQHMA